MESEVVSGKGARFSIYSLGSDRPDALHLLWGHGWGQSAMALQPMAESLASFAYSTLIDFPGFGASPPPPGAWGTADYADAVAEWLQTQPLRRRVWIGHSFGGRVGIRLAARHPQLVGAMVLIASAGLRPKRPLRVATQTFLKVKFFKLAKALLGEGPAVEKLRRWLGSIDYYKAGPLRPVLVKAINENLSEDAARVKCPVLLLYGEQDTITPVEVGQRLHSLIPHSELLILQRIDHHSIVGDGRHVAAHQILSFLQNQSKP